MGNFRQGITNYQSTISNSCFLLSNTAQVRKEEFESQSSFGIYPNNLPMKLASVNVVNFPETTYKIENMLWVNINVYPKHILNFNA